LSLDYKIATENGTDLHLSKYTYRRTLVVRIIQKNAFLVMAIAFCGCAIAETPQTEQLLMSVATDFELGADLGRNGNTFKEFVKRGQSVQDWSEMITVEIYQGAAITPAQFLQNLGGKIVSACPGTVSKRNIINGTTNGYQVSMLDLWCPTNPSTSKPESILIRVIKGEGRLYSVQYAWRSTPSNDQVDAAVTFLRNVSVCDTRSAAHACPVPAQVSN
jgi:hypothetical protein